MTSDNPHDGDPCPGCEARDAEIADLRRCLALSQDARVATEREKEALTRTLAESQIIDPNPLIARAVADTRRECVEAVKRIRDTYGEPNSLEVEAYNDCIIAIEKLSTPSGTPLPKRPRPVLGDPPIGGMACSICNTFLGTESWDDHLRKSHADLLASCGAWLHLYTDDSLYCHKCGLSRSAADADSTPSGTPEQGGSPVAPESIGSSPASDEQTLKDDGLRQRDPQKPVNPEVTKQSPQGATPASGDLISRRDAEEAITEAMKELTVSAGEGSGILEALESVPAQDLVNVSAVYGYEAGERETERRVRTECADRAVEWLLRHTTLAMAERVEMTTYILKGGDADAGCT